MDTVFNIYERIQEESKQRMDVGWSGVKMKVPWSTAKYDILQEGFGGGQLVEIPQH